MGKAINSKRKGSQGERDIAAILREHGYADARRGQQFAGHNGDPDVCGLPNFHLEVKRVEHLNLGAAFEQSVRDARDGEIPVVVHRRNRKPWMITMRFEDFLPLLEKE